MADYIAVCSERIAVHGDAGVIGAAEVKQCNKIVDIKIAVGDRMIHCCRRRVGEFERGGGEPVKMGSIYFVVFSSGKMNADGAMGEIAIVDSGVRAAMQNYRVGTGVFGRAEATISEVDS